MRMNKAILTIATILTFLNANSSFAEGTPTAFKLTSSSFEDGGLMDRKYAAKGGPRKCDGENISPELSWQNAPNGTKSYAIITFDATGRHGLGVVHWVAYGIPASATNIAEGATSGFIGGLNSIRKNQYFGPCPDVGNVPHIYEFLIIALDFEPDALAVGFTRNDLMKTIKDHNLGATSIIGRYAR